MTTSYKASTGCPAEKFLQSLSGKWKPQLFKLAAKGPIRFNRLMRELEGVNKQSLSKALKEMQEAGYLNKVIVCEKPLHIEYSLSEKGKALIPVFQQIEGLINE